MAVEEMDEILEEQEEVENNSGGDDSGINGNGLEGNQAIIN